jgi:hypothetical protein
MPLFDEFRRAPATGFPDSKKPGAVSGAGLEDASFREL